MTKTIETIKSWDMPTQERESRIARHLFVCGCYHSNDDERESCGACALFGFLSDSSKADGMTETSGPNYAGWARAYVQAQRRIPIRWLKAFGEQMESDNEAYAGALMRDIATWGVRFN